MGETGIERRVLLGAVAGLAGAAYAGRTVAAPAEATSPRQAWAHRGSVRVMRDGGDELLDEDGPFRPRPDEGHVAMQDVNGLRNLVDAGEADEAAHPRYPAIAHRGPNRRAGLLGIDRHGAELQDMEAAMVLSHAFLAVKERPA